MIMPQMKNHQELLENLEEKLYKMLICLMMKMNTEMLDKHLQEFQQKLMNKKFSVL
jgi:hypothetical protein